MEMKKFNYMLEIDTGLGVRKTPRYPAGLRLCRYPIFRIGIKRLFANTLNTYIKIFGVNVTEINF